MKDDDAERQQHTRGPTEQDAQHERDAGDREQHEDPNIARHVEHDSRGDERPAAAVEPKSGPLEAIHDPAHREIRRCRLLSGDIGRLDLAGVGLLEAGDRVVTCREIRVGIQPERHRGYVPVARDQRIDIQGRRERDLPDAFQLLSGRGPVLEKLPHEEFGLLASCDAGVHETRDLLEVRHFILERRVERPQPLEELEAPQIGRLDGDENEILTPELRAELVVGHAGRIVLLQQRFGRGIERHVGESRAERRCGEQHGSHDPPAMAGNEVRPALEVPLDPDPDGTPSTPVVAHAAAASAHLVRFEDSHDSWPRAMPGSDAQGHATRLRPCISCIIGATAEESA
jgi:hypothetical protein